MLSFFKKKVARRPPNSMFPPQQMKLKNSWLTLRKQSDRERKILAWIVVIWWWESLSHLTWTIHSVILEQVVTETAEPDRPRGTGCLFRAADCEPETLEKNCLEQSTCFHVCLYPPWWSLTWLSLWSASSSSASSRSSSAHVAGLLPKKH